MCYRLLDAEWWGRSGRLDFGYVSFFDAMDISEAVSHEYAVAWLAGGRRLPTLDVLPLRSAVVDPLDLAARPVFTGLHTLTIRRDTRGDHRFSLHHRDARAVASAGGVHHVIPAGALQPSVRIFRARIARFLAPLGKGQLAAAGDPTVIDIDPDRAGRDGGCERDDQVTIDGCGHGQLSDASSARSQGVAQPGRVSAGQSGILFDRWSIRDRQLTWRADGVNAVEGGNIVVVNPSEAAAHIDNA